MVSIVQFKNPILKQAALLVPKEMIGTAKMAKILSDMSKALAQHADGVALAAPQIGLSWRIFIVSHQLFNDPDQLDDIVFINPKITKKSRRRSVLDEGCLSVRGKYGKTRRSDKVTVNALDESGRPFSWNGTGLMAQIFQHEIDHLDGILFIDHATCIIEDKSPDHGPTV